MSSKPAITLNDSSANSDDAKARARAAINRAKGQSSARPVAPDLRQRFDQPADPVQEEKPAALRQETTEGLEAMMAASVKQAAERAKAGPAETPMEVPPSKLLRFSERLIKHREDNYSESLADSVKAVAKDLHLPDPPTPEEAERAEWEKAAKLEPLSIDSYIMNGVVQQVVPVLGDRLRVAYRTTLEGTEAFIETRMRDFRRDSGSQMLMTEFYRQQARLALAAQIVSYGTNKWPSLLDANGEVDAKAFDSRLALVKQIPAPIFPKVAQHLGWFNSRVDALLKTSDVLGNG